MIDILRTLIICVSLHPISNQQKIDMQKNLVIVESPAKAKTIEKFLGKDYKVMSSYGHIRDLKTKDFSIDLEHNYAPEYVIPSDKKKLVTELKNEAKKAEQVWLASDEDREGEAISWHLYEVLGLKPENTKRIVFHEITKNAILHAIETPRDINIDLVNAQQARRILDRIVGFELSPILWRKVKPALSAGRVQSVAVRLIVEREREINEFVSEAAYRVIASFILPDGTTILKAELNRRLKDKEEVEAFLESCKDASFTIDDISKKPVRKTPAPPFTTSTLQQEAARKLGYSVSQTMMIAQRLYESGLITYMRTDSVNLSDLALGTAKEAILDTYGEKYYKFRQYHTKSKGAQEAHEAIRPTYISNDEISGTAQEKRLYELIRKRTIACQMADAELERPFQDAAVNDEKLAAKNTSYEGITTLTSADGQTTYTEVPKYHVTVPAGAGTVAVTYNKDVDISHDGATVYAYEVEFAATAVNRAAAQASGAMALREDSLRLDDPRLLSAERLAVVLGTEGDGLADGTIAQCDHTVMIPMTHGVDSLNVAAAAAVAFYQLGLQCQ